MKPNLQIWFPSRNCIDYLSIFVYGTSRANTNEHIQAMLSDFGKEHLREQVESFKDEIDFIKTILKDNREVELFVFSRAMERLAKCMPSDVCLDGSDFSYSAAQSIDNLTKEIMKRQEP